MTEPRARKGFRRVLLALWLILAPIPCLYILSWATEVYLDVGWMRFVQGGIAAAFCGAAILFFTRVSSSTRVLAFVLYLLVVGAMLPFLLTFIVCGFIASSCP
jgi:hypothetical protein